jgi:hypothetical protein
MKKYSILLILFVLGVGQALAQSSEQASTHHLGFGLQYHQIKESANYGLVNQGLNLSLNYDYQNLNNNRLFSYNPLIAFGPNYRYGLGLNWHFKFVDFYYGFRICNKDNRALYLGPYASINYLLQMYPEMQSGNIFWFTTMEVGPKLQWFLKFGERTVTVKASTSVAGYTSRPEESTEKYFYSQKISDIISNSHSDLQFGSFNSFNHTYFEVNYANPVKNKLSLGYAFEYFGYYNTPTFTYLTHSILLKWQLGK